MLEILEAESDENLEQIRTLFGEYAGTLDFGLDFQNFDKELANLPDDYTRPAGCLLLAFHKGQLAGCVGLRKLSDGICEMKRLYVKEQFRGLGIGRALTEAVVKEAQKIGYNYMRLDTVPSMEVARALYSSLGFKQTTPYRYNPIEGAVFMELRLM
jgi:ribosomal protein S18 acetylase RimI-like enzyme